MKSKKTGSIFIIALAMVGSLVVAFSRSAAVEAVTPVEKAANFFSRQIWSRFSGLWRGAEARAENIRLKREVASLAMVRTDFERVTLENTRLRAALEYVQQAPGQWLAAGVLSNQGGAVGANRVIRIDKGSLAGVQQGAVVRVPEGLVGRVQTVTPHTSEVLLISDTKLKVSCSIEGSPGVMGILSGGTDDLLILRHVHAASPIAPRSRVLTTGAGGVFPAGIPVGTLLSCESREEDSAREGEVLPAVDFSTLEDVFIRCEK